MNNNNVDELLKYDPIADAEKITGTRGNMASWLGLALAMDHNKRKEETLTELGDSAFRTDINRYIRIIESIGFEQVLCIPFMGRSYSDAAAPEEKFYIFFDKARGILLDFDTYNGKSVNGGKFSYNIQFNQNDNRDWNITSSGQYTQEGVWVGDHDCREAIKHKIARLEENGEFLTKWVQRPFLWLLHYMDTEDKSYDYKAINESRLAMLPDYVLDAITPSQ